MNTKFYEEISQPLKTKRVKAGNQGKITTLNEDPQDYKCVNYTNN